MGRVYRATQRPIDKVVAIKVLHANMGADPGTLQRFLREAKAASRFDHPNSVAVFDFGHEADGTAYIVMEYLRGESLESFIGRNGPMRPEDCVSVLGQVLSALAEAHDAGIVHRDLKPENIMLVARGGDGADGFTVKVADFGIAKILDERGDGRDSAKLTATGLTPGSPAYMSPEQALAKDVDRRSDLYQCGVILYEMLTGEIPFMADSAIAVIMLHISAAAPSPRVLRADCPDVLAAVVLRAMEKDPANRFADAREMRAALRGGTSTSTTNVAPQVVVAAGKATDPGAFAQTLAGVTASDLARPTDSMVRATPAATGPTPAGAKVLPVKIGASMVLAACAVAAIAVLARPSAPAPAPVLTPVRPFPMASPTPAPAEAAATAPQAASSPMPSHAAEPSPAPVAVVQAPANVAVDARPGARSHAPRGVVAGAVPSVVAPAAPVVATAPTPAPAPAEPAQPPPPPSVPAAVVAPTLRTVHPEVTELRATAGLGRSAVQGVASRAADALAQCVFRASSGHVAPGPSTASVVVVVRDRHADEVRVTGSTAAVGCHAAVAAAFHGELPQAEDTDYEIRFGVALTPVF